jgi:UDP-glucose 4-epimerase
MLKVLVTGGAGFIGSNLVDKLLDHGHEVTVIDNESSNSNEVFYWNKKASNHKLNICDYDAILPLFKDVDIVYHVAAEARIQPSLNNPILTAKTNTLGTCTVLQCAREAGVKRVIYSSTSSAYGRKNSTPSLETMQKDCLSPYSVTKTCGEELCKMFTDLFDLETVVFRYFNVYGERQPLNKKKKGCP